VPLYLIFIGVRAIVRKVRGNKKKVEVETQPETEKKK
jgi:hypothetical protein